MVRRPSAAARPPPPCWAFKIALGVALIAYGERRRRRIGRLRRPPAWAARLDGVSVWTAAGLAVLLQPWGLVVAGCATVVDADLSDAGTWFALLGFCLLASASLLAMQIYATFSPEAAQERLARLRAWMESHQDQTVVSLSLFVGLWLVGRSIYQLVT
ncbi:GAP family protein [Streptomyces sp. CB03911]|uniref:GAP family protein n=1 Tax=Streptomycetaceae TaxID=2062 RepID=UPI0026860084